MTDLPNLRALCEAATQPGPWTVITNDAAKGNDGHSIVLDANGMWVADCGVAPHDAAFIAAAREAVPQLLAECEALRRTEKFLRYYEIPDDAIRTLTANLRTQTEGTPHEAIACDAATNIEQLTRERDEWKATAETLRSLLREAVGIAREYVGGGRHGPITERPRARIDAIAKDGGIE